jgi:hypothetical protein
MSVFTPLQQVANITSIAAAGLLAATVLRGMHLVVAGVTFGPSTRSSPPAQSAARAHWVS